MLNKLGCTILLVVSVVVGLSAQSKLDQKFYKAIETTYEVELYEVEEIFAPEVVNQKLPAKTGDSNLFEITSEGTIIGYAYLGTAPSKKEVFEYVVLFDKDLIVKKAKVLIYRENYGLQIGTQRWLKQFIGMTPESEVKYGENVAAISGATISASSMAEAVNNVLKTVSILQAEEIL